MKNYLALVLLLLSMASYGQNIWNKKLPVKNFGTLRYMDASFENDRILVASGRNIAELEPLGTITGYNSFSINSNSINFVRKRIDNQTGNPYLLLGSRGVTGGSKYKLQLLVPGVGISSEIYLSDILANSSSLAPSVIVQDDSTIVLFGRQKAYKVRSHGSSSFTVIWEKNLIFPGTGESQAAVTINNDFVLLSLDGSVVGVNSAGQQIFTYSHPFKFYGAAVLPDGIIACGTNSDQKAVLVKLAFTGNLLWSQVYNDALYRHVAVTPDGGFVATGNTDAGDIVLIKTGGNGQEQWRKTYQPGIGYKVIPMHDGGYFMAALSGNMSDYYGIKTDTDGETTAPDNKIFIEKRALQSEGLIMNLGPISSLFDPDKTSLFMPAETQKTTINAFFPWMAGRSTDGQLHFAAETYNTSTFQDYQAGPIGGSTRDFSKVWLVKKEQIYALRRDYLLDQSLNELVPYDLLTWPARGNQHLRYNIDFTQTLSDPMFFSAPFVDFNGDGIYNVYDGDYPKIKGDQMVWWSFNDDSPANNGHGEAMKADISMSAYLYDCSDNESIKNSFFVDYKIINRSTSAYDSTFIGFFTDFDLGCHLDDNIGSIPESNTFYTYNQTAVDSNICGSAQSYGNNVPIQTVTFQDKDLSHFSCYNNNIGPVHPATTDPGSPLEYYHYLQGLWKDGTPLTLGGSGYNPGSTDYIAHAFPSNPSDPQGWSMCTANLPYADRRALGAHGPFTFSPGETFKVSVAFTTHNSIPLPCPDVFGLIKPAIEQLSGWSNDGILEATPNLGIVQELHAGQTLTLGMNIPGAMFQWSTGASSPTIMVSGPGEYSVTVTGETGCQSVENVLVKLVAGTTPNPAMANWSMYPNPATDFIQVACPDCNEGETLQIVLRNAQGAVVRVEKVASSTFPVQLQGLSSGLFWLELWQGGVYLGSKKFAHVIR